MVSGPLLDNKRLVPGRNPNLPSTYGPPLIISVSLPSPFTMISLHITHIRKRMIRSHYYHSFKLPSFDVPSFWTRGDSTRFLSPVLLLYVILLLFFYNMLCFFYINTLGIYTGISKILLTPILAASHKANGYVITLIF